MQNNSYSKFLFLREIGQGVVEYAIIVAVVIAVVIGLIASFGDAIQELWQRIADTISKII